MDTKETTTYYAIVIAAGVLGSIIFYFIISVIRQQRKNRLLYKAKLEAEITTLEKERARVAADLHDELGPTLSAAKFKLGSIDSLQGDDEVMIGDSIRHIDSILQQVRRIANGLMPNTLKRKGPIAAIEEFIDHMKANSGLDICFKYEFIPPIEPERGIHIYRIIQEITNNAVKHAHGSRLKIELYIRDNKLVIATADNGCGFDHDELLKEKNGLGLSNLRSRAEILSGELFISSRRGKGTSHTIEIPLTPLKYPV